jgi:hypothetical protein
MNREELVTKLSTFATEAREVADAWATVRKDDNSYDAGAIAGQAEEFLDALSTDVSEQTLKEIEAWLEQAPGKLDSIG